MGKSPGLMRVEAGTWDQLVEEHRIAVITEELEDLQLEQQQTAAEEIVSEKEVE